jgi:hypothetical protein
MNQRTRRAALLAIGAIAMLASANALAHSYAGLYGWAVHHRLGGWQAMSWPGEVDVFLVIGELALYVAYLDAWPARHKLWPWVTAVTGLIVSVAGNIGHVEPLEGQPVTLADRLTAATSPVAAFAGLTVALLVLKMTRQQGARKSSVTITPAGLALTSRLVFPVRVAEPSGGAGSVTALRAPDSDRHASPLLRDATDILQAARARGDQVSQRSLAAQLHERGHRFSNAQLRGIAGAIGLASVRRAA